MRLHFFLRIEFSDSVHRYFLNQTILNNWSLLLKLRFACTTFFPPNKDYYWYIHILPNFVLSVSSPNYQTTLNIRNKNWSLLIKLSFACATFFSPKRIIIDIYLLPNFVLSVSSPNFSMLLDSSKSLSRLWYTFSSSTMFTHRLLNLWFTPILTHKRDRVNRYRLRFFVCWAWNHICI